MDSKSHQMLRHAAIRASIKFVAKRILKTGLGLCHDDLLMYIDHECLHVVLIPDEG